MIRTVYFMTLMVFLGPSLWGQTSASSREVLYEYFDAISVEEYEKWGERFQESEESIPAPFDFELPESVQKELFAVRNEYFTDDFLFFKFLEYKSKDPLRLTSRGRVALYTRMLEDIGGFKVVVTKSLTDFFIDVFSNDNLQGHSTFTFKGNQYFNLWGSSPSSNKGLELVYFTDDSGEHESFSFVPTRIPGEFPKRFRTKQYVFGGRKFDVPINMSAVYFLSYYPILPSFAYANLPLDSNTTSVLNRELRVPQRDTLEALGVILSFVRNSVNYTEEPFDSYSFNESLSAAGSLWLSEVDCEDKAALFHQLVREWLNIPSIMVVFPNHISIGVSVLLEKNDVESIWFEGNEYFLADPTNDTEIGQFPLGHKNKDIIAIFPLAGGPGSK